MSGLWRPMCKGAHFALFRLSSEAHFPHLWALPFLASLSRATPTTHTSIPIVNIKNGTLAGSYDSVRHQDAFLSVPFAASPTGNFRFSLPRAPKPWKGIKPAKSYGPLCLGNSIGLIGFSQNTATDPRYNGSFLVETSVQISTPIIFVSLNYRLGVFGMMNGPAAAKAGPPNLFLHGQRQALRWIQENIAHFGGDASRVTIAEESTSASSVGQHLIAYGGLDEALFSGAIAQSGGPQSSSSYRNATETEAYSRRAIEETECTEARDQLSCLRAVPVEALIRVSQILPTAWVVDGELFTSTGSRPLEVGSFFKVPLLIGSNRNEGAPLVQLFGFTLNFDDDFLAFAKGYLGPSPAGLGTVLSNPGLQLGAQDGKVSLWFGDAYFFETPSANLKLETLGVAHFQEIPFTFANTKAVGWDTDPFPSEPEKRQKYLKLAERMKKI
ncbi:Alpha/Beta hydrolase protein [Dactylonectria macrodidyma]|uniref:Alpha/Beta hydrolase protein n=1 Tax=Dactylonectria macrodidyma TaxID=307937 RepID=A0A9P9J3K8_9HYPO|nr:Alpha/Beta hydrolase protein [Dactylonectria macrodidyma]